MCQCPPRWTPVTKTCSANVHLQVRVFAQVGVLRIKLINYVTSEQEQEFLTSSIRSNKALSVTLGMAFTDYKWTKWNLTKDCRFRFGFASLHKLQCGSIPRIRPLSTNRKRLLDIVLAVENYLMRPELFTLPDYILVIYQSKSTLSQQILSIAEVLLCVCVCHTAPKRIQGLSGVKFSVQIYLNSTDVFIHVSWHLPQGHSKNKDQIYVHSNISVSFSAWAKNVKKNSV